MADSTAQVRSEIPDVSSFITTETDPEYTAWDKSTGIEITESQISDLKSYLTTESDPTLNSNFDFSGATTGDLLRFNGTKWVKFTPNYLTGYTETQNLADVAAISNSVNTQLKDVTDPTDDQDAATKKYVDDLIGQLYEQGVLQLKDADENLYSVVKIGEQYWMAENLKTIKYNDGTPIAKVTDNTEWYNLSTGAYCWYNNDSATYEADYGKLYNFFTISTGKLCPTGWHVPDETELNVLIDYLGGLSVASGKLKETGTTHWTSPNIGATNETGFTGLPDGYREMLGTFYEANQFGKFWLSTTYGPTAAYFFELNYANTEVWVSSVSTKSGHSVRCIKD